MVRDRDYLSISLIQGVLREGAYQDMSTPWYQRPRFTFGEMSRESRDDLSTG
jgi:hypothetical protein